MAHTEFLYRSPNPRSVWPREYFTATAKLLKGRSLGFSDDFMSFDYRYHLIVKYEHRNVPDRLIQQAIRYAYSSHGCWCSHDCCGCRITYVHNLRRIGRGRYVFDVHFSRNY